MQLSYRPTFAQFADNYLATYYSGGVKTLQRIAGGPALMLAGTLAIVFAFDRLHSWLLRAPAIVAGAAIALYGLSYTLGPLFNVFLVWLRRDQLFENEQALTTLELEGETLRINQSGEEVTMPLNKIKSMQHRGDSTWILTENDTLIYVPREGLISGDHDEFVQAIEEKIAPEEKEE
jgi:hypothetical protein